MLEKSLSSSYRTYIASCTPPMNPIGILCTFWSLRNTMKIIGSHRPSDFNGDMKVA